MTPPNSEIFRPRSVCTSTLRRYPHAMNALTKLNHWRDLTLPGQFLLAGAVVMLLAMAVVGHWVSARIENAVVQNSATSAALYMESFISPLSQELAETETLSPPARQALAEIFDGTALGDRVVSFKIWMPDGLVVHASDPTLIGQRFDPSDDLVRASGDEVSSSFEDLDELESEAEAALGVPLLEVYSPIRQLWTGDVIAIAEFYERADDLSDNLARARRTSWLVVGGAFLTSGLILFGIVQAGGRTIRHQRQVLQKQLIETKTVSQQNVELRRKVVAASSRATAQNERAIRRIGFDLHDGPAQYLSLASLRLDGAFAEDKTASTDAVLVRDALDKALDEIRIISRGLALPDLDGLGLYGLIDRASQDHQKQTGMKVDRPAQVDPEPSLNYAQKLCVFRFLQEALSNATRHGGVETATVTVRNGPEGVALDVRDAGVGFDMQTARYVRDDGGQGLFALADRAESIGGKLQITSSPGKGTSVTLHLPHEEIST